MKSLNKVQIIGNVGSDPDIRATNDGTKYGRVSVATNKSFKDRNGQQHDSTEWHRVVVWRSLADIVEQYVKKGDRIYFEGELRTSSYEQDGVKRYSTEVIAREMIMLGGGGEGAVRAPVIDLHPGSSPPEDDFNDDIPF